MKKSKIGKAMEINSIKAAIANGGGLTEEQVKAIAKGVMAPLINEVVPTLTIITPSEAVEVGSSTTPELRCNITNSENAESAVLKSGSIVLDTITLAESGETTVTITRPTTAKNTVASVSYTLSVTDKAGRVIVSDRETINWQLGVYYGSSSSETLDESGIKSLTKTLKSTMEGTYEFDDGTTSYKYIVIPSSFTTLSMFDNNTSSAFPLQQVATVNVTVNDITTSYKVLRSEDQVGDVIVRS